MNSSDKKILDDLVQGAFKKYREKYSDFRYHFNISYESRAPKGCCPDDKSNMIFTYQVKDRQINECLKSYYGYDVSYKGISVVREIIKIRGAPTKRLLVDLLGNNGRCCLGTFTCLLGVGVFVFPIFVYQCLHASEKRDQAIDEIVDLIREGEKWVSTALNKGMEMAFEEQKKQFITALSYKEPEQIVTALRSIGKQPEINETTPLMFN